MLLLFSILGGLLLLVLLLLYTATLLGVDYLFENKHQCLKIRVRLLGISFSFTIPLEKKEKASEKSDAKDEKKSMTPKEYIAFSKNLYQVYRELEEECKEVLRDIKRLASCREIYFTIHYGMKNPAVTGMLNGAIWTASTLILKILDSAVGCLKKTLNVYPDFKQECMCIHIKGTFCFRFIDAVKVVLKVRKLVKLIKSKIKIKTEIEKDGVE